MSWLESIPLTMHVIPTGTAVLDWTVLKEWNIRDAGAAAPERRRVIYFTKSDLHVVGYRVPVRARMSLGRATVSTCRCCPNSPTSFHAAPATTKSRGVLSVAKRPRFPA
jgi:aminopeptidase-like protein